MVDAAVHIGPLGQGRADVSAFYAGCPFEIIGPARIETGDKVPFDTVEGLVEHLLLRTEMYQVVVCHGDRQGGLHLPFTADQANPKITGTGAIMESFVRAVRDSQLQTPDENNLLYISQWTTAPLESVRRLVGKLARLPAHHLEIRGCNVGANSDLLRLYRAAFHALSVSAPNCRMFYLPVLPHTPPGHTTLEALAASSPSKKSSENAIRRRLFAASDPPDGPGPLVLDVIDVDGHTTIQTDAAMKWPALGAGWGSRLDLSWSGSGAHFYTEVLWDNDETSYYVPSDPAFRKRLVRV
jgi:hypothetical protein